MEENTTLILALYAGGLAISCLLYAYRLDKAGENRLCALLGVILGLPLAYAGAKLFFLLQHMGLDIGNWTAEKAFLPRWEEMSFAGGCFGFILGIWIGTKILHVSGVKALDLYAVPCCVLIAFARMAESGMGIVGKGEMPAFLPPVFPFAIVDDWGDAALAVFTFEALAALLCALWLICNSRKQDGHKGQFEKACVILCAAQLFLEMLAVSYWIPFIISFIHLDQVLYAVAMLILVIRGTMRNKKAGPAIVTVLLIGLNALMQFVQDKPYLFPLPEGTDVGTLAFIVFALCSVGLIAAGLRAVSYCRNEGSESSKGS